MPRGRRPDRPQRGARQQEARRRNNRIDTHFPPLENNRPAQPHNRRKQRAGRPQGAPETGDGYQNRRGGKARAAKSDAWKAIREKQAEKEPPPSHAQSAEAGPSSAPAVFDSNDTLRIYGKESSEEGEVDEDEPSEVRTGEIPPYPVRRPYHLGGMGRFGIEIPIIVSVPANSQSALELQAKAQQYSRVSFGTDEFIRLDDDPDDNEDDEGEGNTDEDDEEGLVVQGRSQRRPSTPRISPPDKPPGAGRDYKFNFGQHAGDHFEDILNSDVDYIKTLGGQPSLLDRWGGKLRAAFEYYCPQYMKPKENNTDRHPKDYKFDFGKYSGTRFDQASDAYLRMLEGQVNAGKMDARKGLREAYEWHWWGGKQRAEGG